MATTKRRKHEHVVNWNDVKAIDYTEGAHWGDFTQPLTPSLRRENQHLGVNRVVLPPGRTSCPFHWHVKEDEVFIVLAGRGLLRYGDDTLEVGPGDCISCPRNSERGHQLANVSDADFVYLSIGENRSDEICVYPDSGKLLIRSLGRKIVFTKDAQYMDGEPDPPRILAARDAATASRRAASGAAAGAGDRPGSTPSAGRPSGKPRRRS